MSLTGGEAEPAQGPPGSYADRVFRALALAALYVLLRRWRAGGAGLGERPVPAEIAAAAVLCASVAWLYALPAVGIRRSRSAAAAGRERWRQD